METRASDLLEEISQFCRATGLAESTFGRAAINDGKLVSRLRNGGRITTDTLDRLRAFMANGNGRQHSPDSVLVAHGSPRELPASTRVETAAPLPDPQRNFRFFDNRQKY